MLSRNSRSKQVEPQADVLCALCCADMLARQWALCCMPMLAKKLTVCRAELVLNSGALRQAKSGCHEGVEAAVKVNQGARDGAASLASEEGMSLHMSCDTNQRQLKLFASMCLSIEQYTK